MKVVMESGKYVVAVSGGVDSMVLLDLLARQKNLELVVAHFDHGIREDSGEDRLLVQQATKGYGLVFEYAKGKLGATASEDTARKARYAFLEEIRKKHHAKAIITAHHQDDVLETALLNLLRGTGRKGIAALTSTDTIVRPLLDVTKDELIAYARSHALAWREDSTNKNTEYLRNYIRIRILPNIQPKAKQELLSLVRKLQITNKAIDQEIANYLQVKEENIKYVDKKLLQNVSHHVGSEIIAEWLRLNQLRDFDRKTIERILVAAKTFKPGQRVDVQHEKYVVIGAQTLEIAS